MLFNPEELAEIAAGACRTARYDEYLALTESALEDYEDQSDAIAAGRCDDLDEALCARDDAFQRSMLYATVAAAYRPVVDEQRLAELVAEKLARPGGESR